MNYPSIGQYTEAIKLAAKAPEDYFDKLSNLRPVLGSDGEPIMSSGNFAVVFKMMDKETEQLYALKCFTKEQKGRAEAYRQITEELKNVSSPYLTTVSYYDKELLVDSNQTDETEFPVLLMNWVEGKTLDKYLRDNLKNKQKRENLSNDFYKFAIWLISQSFAHGDLKPDNIIITENGSLVMVDYDGMFVPSMKGQKARELGSPDYRSPFRTENWFNRDIDDFPILTILLSLCIISYRPSFLNKYGDKDRLLFSKEDFLDIEHSRIFNAIPASIDVSSNYKILMKNACEDRAFSLSGSKYRLSSLPKVEKRMTRPISDSKGIDNNGYNSLYFPIEENIVNHWAPQDTYRRQIIEGDSIIRISESSETDSRSTGSTKWQAAFILHVLTIIFAYWVYYSNPESISWDEKWNYIGWGFGIGFIAWFFAYFDYIKRDGSLGNCLFAILLLPLTIYFCIYKFLYLIIDIYKESRH